MEAAHAAIHAVINANKASGVIVRVSAADFMAVLKRAESPVVVVARGGMLKKHFRYLTSYKGLAFYTTSPAAIVLPRSVEAVQAEKIWIPDL
ncbi:MAG: hypothetical protein ACR2G6_12730 [Gemmatimonadaceae bacterium]